MTPRSTKFTEQLALDSGAVLPSFELAYEIYGEISPERDNVILVCHSLTKDCHAVSSGPLDSKGWWEQAIGPGRMLDTNRYCVLSVGALGSRGCSGPASVDELSGRYGMRFPVYTVRDMARAQKHLVDYLRIERLHAVVGGCLGGQQALEWAINWPSSIENAVIISTTPAASAHTIAVFGVMSRLIRDDPAWNGGDYYEGAFPIRGLRNALVAAVPLWMSSEVMDWRFGRRLHNREDYSYSFDVDFEVEAFLDGVAERAAKVIDPNGLLYLMRASSYFDLAGTYGGLFEAVQHVTARVLLISYESDWRYPPALVDHLHNAFNACGVRSIHSRLYSRFGHGAFLHDLSGCGPVISDFLSAAVPEKLHA